MEDILSVEIKIKQIIDELKGLCQTNGLSNQASEEVVITSIFLYKFLNDKFMYNLKEFSKEIKMPVDKILENKNYELDGFYDAYSSDVAFTYDETIECLINKINSDTFYKTFDFRDFKQNINHFSQKERLLSVFGDEMALLNLIYRLNIIGYFEPGQNSRAVRWHYREESISNLCPTLNSYRIDDDSRFKFHNSLEKELAVYIRKRHGTRENGNRQPRVWHFGDDDRNDTVLRR